MQTLRLMSEGHPDMARRVLIAVAAGWGVPAVLVIGSALLGTGSGAGSFFTDPGVYARSLVAVPALILAEPDCLTWLRRVVSSFVHEGIVTGAEVQKFDAALASVGRHLDSRVTRSLVVLVSYATIGALLIYFTGAAGPAWQLGDGARRPNLSLAAWWYALVSLPILLVLLFGWVTRVTVWAVFLWRVARLNLRLVASHPDGAGGLGFVGMSLRGFRLVSLATGALVAGTIANQILQHGLSPFAFKRVVITLLLANVVLFAGPLMVFVRILHETKRRGIFVYGTLAADVGQAFEARWLRQDVDGTGALKATDFSATTDLYSIVANVHGMRYLPFRLIELAGPVGGAALPLVPAALLAMPLSEIASALAQALL
jgi:hypothetical protein